MSSVEPSYSGQQPVAAEPVVRPRNGLGVAALVLGVASLVAVISFVLFPLGLVASLVGLVLAVLALTGDRARTATNRGQAVAGLICCLIALALAITLSVKVGSWAARNTGVITRFDRCLTQAGDRAEVADCIARFANEVRE